MRFESTKRHYAFINRRFLEEVLDTYGMPPMDFRDYMLCEGNLMSYYRIALGGSNVNEI